MVPSVIFIFGLFMNSVNMIDKKFSTVCTRRKENRLHMSFFTYLLDVARVQAYAVFSHVKEESTKKVLKNLREIFVSLS